MNGYRDFLLGALLLILAACGGSGGGSDSGGDRGGNSPSGDADGAVPTPQEPAEHWGLSRATAASVDISQGQVDAILNYVLADAATQSVLVGKDGYVIGEGYASGFDAQSYGTSWSVAKSI